MKTFLAAFLLCSLPVLALAEGNAANESFNQAKRMLERQVYFDHRMTIYCGATFDAQKHVTLPAGFSTPAHRKRALKVEWEHAVPAENFGRAFAEWRNGDAQCVDRKGKAFKGRRCAEKANAEYRRMQADMYNLFPAVGAVNALRGNKPYAALPGSAPVFGSCPAKVGGTRFEPPDRAKGQVARASLYMADSYPKFRLSSQQQKLFEAWDTMFPVDAWECTRAKRIEALQENENPRVKEPCQHAGLWPQTGQHISAARAATGGPGARIQSSGGSDRGPRAAGPRRPALCAARSVPRPDPSASSGRRAFHPASRRAGR